MSLKAIISSLLESGTTIPEPPPSGDISGVAITLDDTNRSLTWAQFDTELKANYDWMATFYAYYSNGPDISTPTQIQALKDLHANGHEIGHHTIDHFYSIWPYMADNDPKTYYDTFIKSLYPHLYDWGFNDVSTFAWPYGYIDQNVSDYLLNNNVFELVRGIVTSNPTIVDDPLNFYTLGDPRPTSLAIDSNQASLDEQLILDTIDYAKANNKIVTFYGHFLAENADFQTVRMPFLRQICQKVVDNNMRFYKMNELLNIPIT